MGADDQVVNQKFSGPYLAEVIRVIDGDTIKVKVAIWPTITVEVSARVLGVDACLLYTS